MLHKFLCVTASKFQLMLQQIAHLSKTMENCKSFDYLLTTFYAQKPNKEEKNFFCSDLLEN